jgi:DNA modification methylase
MESIRHWSAQLAPATILEGDCGQWITEIPDHSIDLLLTDPPYGKNYRTHRIEGEIGPAIEGDRSAAEIETQLRTLGPEFDRVLKLDAHAYVFCDPLRICEVAACFKKVFEWKGIISCIKGRGMGDRTNSGYIHAWEAVLFFTRGKRKLRGHPADAIWVGRTVKSRALHPMQKDLVGLGILIEASTKPGEVILDPFGGSGSTAVAAAICCDQPRKAILIECDPQWVMKSQERLAVLTLVAQRLPEKDWLKK